MLRRLYSTFAGGWPGFGLVVMRLLVGSVLLHGRGPTLSIDLPLHMTFTSASLAVSGLLLIAGLWTPVAGAAVALIEISADPDESPNIHWSGCWQEPLWPLWRC